MWTAGLTDGRDGPFSSPCLQWRVYVEEMAKQNRKPTAHHRMIWNGCARGEAAFR